MAYVRQELAFGDVGRLSLSKGAAEMVKQSLAFGFRPQAFTLIAHRHHRLSACASGHSAAQDANGNR